MGKSLPLDFDVEAKTSATFALSFRVTRFVIAGWAGRDEASLRHHIEELAEIGIAPPTKTPLFYAAAPRLLTQAPSIDVLGAATSGEVEPLLLIADGETYIGLGSDHTDRDAEAWSVPHSKQLCDKPIAAKLWRFADVAPHWDELVLRAWIPGSAGAWILYQEGAVASLRRPDELVALAADLLPGTAMLCGTLPAIGGIRPAEAFRIELHDPVLGRSLAHGYSVTVLPIIT